MSLRRCMLGVALLLTSICSSGWAAIGIYNWSAASSANLTNATISYRLNTNAQSGSILIHPAEDLKKIVKAIVLDPSPTAHQLAKGVNSVVWDGSRDPSGAIPTGECVAEICVNAAPITNPLSSAIVIRNSWPDRYYYGVACDTNPQNSTYGLIYLANAATKDIEIYYPDGEKKGSFYTGFKGSSAPWGIAVGPSGRVYSFDRNLMQIQSFTPTGGTSALAVSGPAYVFGATPVVVGESMPDGTHDRWLYFCDGVVTQGTGNGISRIPIGDDHLFQSGSQRVMDIPGRPFGLSLGWRPTTSASNLYVANFSSGAGDQSNGLEKYHWSGSTWGKQTLIGILPNTACTLAMAPDDTTLFVGLATGGNNLLRVNSATGETRDSFAVAASGVGSVCADAVGNAIFQGGASTLSMMPLTAVLQFPDSGSSDIRTTNSFRIIMNIVRPIIDSAQFSPSTIPGDGSSSTSLSGTGHYELLGSSSITAIIDLSPIGGHQSQILAISKSPSDPNAFGFSLADLKIPAGIRPGHYQLPVTIRDPASGAVSDPFSAELTITGGTLSGRIINEATGEWVSGPATVKAVDSTRSTEYSTATDAEGNFSLEVHPGTFLLIAEKAGYKSGSAVTRSVALGETITGEPYPAVRPMTLAEAKDAYELASGSIFVCVRGVCSGARANTAASAPGFINLFYLRDATVANGVHEGLRVAIDPTSSFNNFYPVEGDDIVLSGTLVLLGASAHQLQNLTACIRLAGGASYGESDLAPLTTVNNDPLNTYDRGWGRLYHVEDLTVAQVDATNLRIKLTNGTDTGWALAAQSSGIKPMDLPPVGKMVDITGIKDRQITSGANCLWLRKPSDISDAVITYTTPANFVRVGWNLVAVPADPVNADPLIIFSGVNMKNASLQYWRNDTPSGFFQLYGSTAGWTGPVLRGTPYWFLELTHTRELSFEGYPPYQDFEMSIPAHPNAPFWVMFGMPFPSKISCASVTFTNTQVSPYAQSWAQAANSPYNYIASKALGFDAAKGQYFTVGDISFAPDRTNLEPWIGYWLLVSRGGKMTIHFPKP